MRKLAVFVVVCFISASTFVLAQSFKFIHETLTGYDEAPNVLSTTGNGEFHARISHNDTRIQYQLSYSDLEGNVTQAHIHLGAKGIAGGIFLFLCSNLGNGPAGTQACPPAPATITGTLTADDMVGSASAQGLAIGEFSEAIRAIRAGATYVNVHTTLFPSGEIRSQIDHVGH